MDITMVRMLAAAVGLDLDEALAAEVGEALEPLLRQGEQVVAAVESLGAPIPAPVFVADA